MKKKRTNWKRECEKQRREHERTLAKLLDRVVQLESSQNELEKAAARRFLQLIQDMQYTIQARYGTNP